MRIFCPAMVASFPSLKPLLVEVVASMYAVVRALWLLSSPTPAVGRVAAEGQAPPVTGSPGIRGLDGPWAPHAQLRKRDAARGNPPGAARSGRDTLTEPKLFKRVTRPPATQPIHYAATRTAM